MICLVLFLHIIGCKSDEEEINTKGNKSVQDNKSKNQTNNEENSSKQGEKSIITLYFSDANAEYLVPEKREISNSSNNSKQAETAIKELIKGPESSDLEATIPSGSRILGVQIQDHTAYVNFSNEIVKNHPGGGAGELLTVYSIVNTLCRFSFINKVKLLVEGANVDTLVGHVDLTQPLELDENIIKNSR